MRTPTRRLPPLILDASIADRLDAMIAPLLASPECPVTASGLRVPSRAALLRLALARGLPALEAELLGRGATR